MIKIIALLVLSTLIGLVAGGALAKSVADAHPLAGCTREQRAQVRMAADDYVIEGSHPVEAISRARVEFCK